MRGGVVRSFSHGDLDCRSDIENWPYCDFLISFFSTGFPLDKAIAYVKHFHPVCINDLPFQQLLQDRRLVLTVLQGFGVPTPHSIWANRDVPYCHSQEVIDAVRASLGVDLSPAAFPIEPFEQVDEDTIRIGDKYLRKPFVEKPASGEDHRVFVYYPKSAGGGARKLFRKVAIDGGVRRHTRLSPLSIVAWTGRKQIV